MSIKKRGILILLALFLLVIPAFSVSATTAITSCKYNISTQGDYNLTQSITSSGQPCINITVSNVSLNCEGYSLTGASMNPGVWINRSLNNITIKNCKFDLFAPNIDASVGGKEIYIINNTINSSPSYGIYFVTINNSIIEDNTIAYNGDETGDTGIRIAFSHRNKIKNNTITLNGGAEEIVYGLYLTTGTYNNITDNTFIDNADIGMVIEESPNTLILNNTVNNNSRSNMNHNGIYVITDSHNATIINNTVKYNDYGIYVISSNDVNITGNTVNNNSVTGILANSVNRVKIIDNTAINHTYGIACVGGSANNITNNTINNNTYGLFFQLDVEDGFVYDNSIKGGTYGVYIFQSSDGNTFRYNNMSNTVDIVIQSSSGNKFFDNTVNPNSTQFSFVEYSGDVNVSGVDSPPPTNPYRNISLYLNVSGTDWIVMNISYTATNVAGVFESSLTMMRYNGSDWVSITTTLDETNNIVSSNLSSFSIFGPLANPQCGNINDSTTLLSNISVNSSCFVINNSDIIFDCDGYILLGNQSGYGFNLTSKDNITIKNCKIYNFTNGIYLSTSSNNTILNNSVFNSSSCAIYFASNAHNNSIQQNTLSENTGSGVYTANSCDNIFSDNLANNNTNGFNFASSSNLNTFINNTAMGNSWRGIAITDSHYNVLTGFNLSNRGPNLWDLRFSSSENNTVYDASISGSYTAKISFIEYNGSTTEIQGAKSPAVDPSGKKNISRYINITKTDGDYIEINISYEDSDIPADISESTLKIYQYNDDFAWTELTTTSDTTNNILYSNITDFSIFGILGDEPAQTTSSGGGGGGGGYPSAIIKNYNITDNEDAPVMIPVEPEIIPEQIIEQPAVMSAEQKMTELVREIFPGVSKEKASHVPVIAGIIGIIIILFALFFWIKKEKVRKPVKKIPKIKQEKTPIIVRIKKTVFKPGLLKAFKDFKKRKIIQNIISSKKEPAKVTFAQSLPEALKKAKAKPNKKKPKKHRKKKAKRTKTKKKSKEPKSIKKLRILSKQPKQPDVFDTLQNLYSGIKKPKK